jgi:hypothetical protein
MKEDDIYVLSQMRRAVGAYSNESGRSVKRTDLKVLESNSTNTRMRLRIFSNGVTLRSSVDVSREYDIRSSMSHLSRCVLASA